MSAQLFDNSFQNYPKVTISPAKVEIAGKGRNLSKLIKPYSAFFMAAIWANSVWFWLPDLNTNARISFIVFGLAVIGWTMTKINDTYIALTAASMVSVTGFFDTQRLFASLGDSTIWLLLSSFIIAAGITSTGLTDRLTKAVISRSVTVNGLFYSITAIILVTAFFVPSTSGRAALMLPIYSSLSRVFVNRNIRIALSLLFPSIILLSAIASLTGAAAHLVTAEILVQMGGEKITFARWMMLGLPFATVSCFVSTFIILQIFLDKSERTSRFEGNTEEIGIGQHSSGSWSLKEKFAFVVITVLVGLWATESIHGLSTEIIALCGALILTSPVIGTIQFKEAVKQINWNMLIFLAASMLIAESLIESGGAKWIVEKSFAVMHLIFNGNVFLIVTVVAGLSLLSHLVINSRTARSSVLVPMVIILAVSLGINATALAFISTAAAGFCLTLVISAKPVLMFSQCDRDTFEQKDLLYLSMILLPIHLFLLIIFTFFVYPFLGLDIFQVK